MKDHYYLDNAATSWPKPEVVYETMDRLFRQLGVNPGRAGHELSVEAEKMILATRRMLGEFFNFSGPPERVVFTQNATDSLNMVLFGLLHEGDHVITTRLEHNAVARPLNYLRRDRGVDVTQVQRDAQGYVDPDDILKAVRPNTRVIVVNHASNVLGSVQDIATIGRIARESDAVFVVDTCQSAGVLALDQEAMNIDIVTFTGHKGLMGPMGIGGLLLAQDIDLPPARVGGTGVNSIGAFQPDEYPYHLEAGTVNLPGIAGLYGAQKWFAELGREASGDEQLNHRQACLRALSLIEHNELRQIRALEIALRAMEGVTVYGPQGNGPRIATLSMNIGDLPADQVGAMLDADHHVCVRPGLHCAPHVHEDEGTVAQNGTVRFSLGYFTDDEDIDQAIAGVADILEG